MVREDVAASPDGRQPVKDERVLAAMRAVPRHLFVRRADQGRAYNDYPLLIGHDQTISQPYIVALTTEALRVSPGDRILEIGTGSGYQAAILTELTPEVYTIEIVKPLADEAAARLKRLGYTTVHVRSGDGYYGWPEAAPFDGIVVTCSAENIPSALWQQLKVGGRVVIPIGEEMRVQQLTVVTKRPDGTRHTEVLTPCAFVPMTGKIRQR
jgi:protein-L-isoaspartate(D-aspartate) O-methyltransferase